MKQNRKNSVRTGMPEDSGARGRRGYVRLLSDGEKALTRPLYEEAFPEDGTEMTDCYYRTAMADNEVMACLAETCVSGNPGGDAGDRTVSRERPETWEIRGMLCMNPYRVSWFGEELRLSYIVAVATAKAHRREGVMREVLTAALRHLKERGDAFTFLKPANPAYYTPFGFAYFSGREGRRRKAGTDLSREILRSPADLTPSLAAETAAFMNRFLGEHFDLFCLRDEAYLSRLMQELSAGGGSLTLLRTPEDGALRGCVARDYPGVPEEEARFLAEDPWSEPVTPVVSRGIRKPDARSLRCGESQIPFMMGRVVDLKVFLEMFRLSEGSAELEFFFEDPLIPENMGLWRWHLTEKGSEAVRLSETLPEQTAAIPLLSSEELLPWLLGYSSEETRRLFPGGDAAVTAARIRRCRGAYFDEEM